MTLYNLLHFTKVSFSRTFVISQTHHPKFQNHIWNICHHHQDAAGPAGSAMGCQMARAHRRAQLLPKGNWFYSPVCAPQISAKVSCWCDPSTVLLRVLSPHSVKGGLGRECRWVSAAYLACGLSWKSWSFIYLCLYFHYLYLFSNLLLTVLEMSLIFPSIIWA